MLLKLFGGLQLLFAEVLECNARCSSSFLVPLGANQLQEITPLRKALSRTSHHYSHGKYWFASCPNISRKHPSHDAMFVAQKNILTKSRNCQKPLTSHDAVSLPNKHLGHLAGYDVSQPNFHYEVAEGFSYWLTDAGCQKTRGPCSNICGVQETTWQDIAVGDVMVVREGDGFAADVVPLYCCSEDS